MTKDGEEVSASILVDPSAARIRFKRRRRWPVFLWRRELQPKPPAAVVENGAMLPVEIVPERRRPRRADAGCIEIEFGSGSRVQAGTHPATARSPA
jgi:hypothetical protein